MGGIYSVGPAAAAEVSYNFIKNILGFFGVTDIETIIVEGHNQVPDQAETIISTGIVQAEKAAAGF